MKTDIKEIAKNIETHYKLGLDDDARRLFYESGYDGIVMIEVWDFLSNGTKRAIKELQVNHYR